MDTLLFTLAESQIQTDKLRITTNNLAEEKEKATCGGNGKNDLRREELWGLCGC